MENLKESCLNLERLLKYNDNSDIDGLDISWELNFFREMIQVENDTLIDILKYIIILDSFQNAFIVYRITLTISVNFTLAKRSFSN